MTKQELQFFNLLLKVFSKHLKLVSQDILAANEFDLSKFELELKGLLQRELQLLYIDFFERAQEEIEESVTIGTEPINWANISAVEITGQILTNTERMLNTVIATNMEHSLTLGEIVQLLEPIFGVNRAERIAVTETTRASSFATNQLQGFLQEQGFDYYRVWATNADELVCPICGKLDKKPEKEWRRTFPKGPPAHPNCRCATVLKRKPVRKSDSKIKPTKAHNRLY